MGERRPLSSPFLSALRSRRLVTRPACTLPILITGWRPWQPLPSPSPATSAKPPGHRRAGHPQLFAMAERDTAVFLAKLAEQAERYDEMVRTIAGQR